MEILPYEDHDLTVVDPYDRKVNRRKYSDDKIDRTTSVTIPLSIQPKFDSPSLKQILKSTIRIIKSSPIEYEEIKLYKLTQAYHTFLGGLSFDISFFGKIHHLISLQKLKYTMTESEISLLSEQMNDLSSEDSYIFQKYKLISKVLNLCGRLLVKWNIFKSQNYEFRYSGRSLNVRLLDLEKISSTALSLDTFWFSFSIFDKPICDLAEPSVLEMAKIVRHAASDLFFFLLGLNVPNQNYKIKEVVAYNSEKYKKFNDEIVPQVNIGALKHQGLGYKKGIFTRCFSRDTVLDQLYEKLCDFELVFRNFEKELIITLLGASKYVYI
jgi:hypothetical protein